MTRNPEKIALTQIPGKVWSCLNRLFHSSRPTEMQSGVSGTLLRQTNDGQRHVPLAARLDQDSYASKPSMSLGTSPDMSGALGTGRTGAAIALQKQLVGTWDPFNFAEKMGKNSPTSCDSEKDGSLLNRSTTSNSSCLHDVEAEPGSATDVAQPGHGWGPGCGGLERNST